MLIKGHEFHHSRLLWSKPLDLTYRVMRGHGVNGRGDGITYKNLFASYTHLHVAAAPGWAQAFTALLRNEKKRKLRRRRGKPEESSGDAVTSI
jgi:cobyrinic acid a,c-diamide synthase